MDFKTLFLILAAIIFLVIVISVLFHKQKTNNGSSEISFGIKVPKVMETNFSIKSKYKGEEMYNLDFKKNKDTLNNNIQQLKKPEYQKMDFNSVEFYLNFLKSLEEKKNVRDEIEYSETQK
jgi:uncharacterized protein (UPF0333 family)